jgi:hypothetical protein
VLKWNLGLVNLFNPRTYLAIDQAFDPHGCPVRLNVVDVASLSGKGTRFLIKWHWQCQGET